MTKRRKFYLIFLLLPLFYLCSSSIPETHYYLIDYPVKPDSSKSEPIHEIVLGVERFKAAPLYKEERLVYRDSPYEGKYYNYHRWITSPEEMITDKVIEQLKAANLFDRVVPFPGFSQVDYILQGTIKALEEWDEKDEWYARVQLALDLVDGKTNQVVWQKIIKKKNKVTTKSPVEVVKGINMSIQQSVEDVQQELDVLFRNY